MAGKIVIDDLRHPVLTDDQRAFMAEAVRNPPTLTEAAVLEAAAQRTGLDNFGPDDFRERLRLILGEVDADPNATAFVKAGFFTRAVGAAANRLQTMDLLRRHPEIHDIEVAAPIIIAGLPRSGTTHLLGLIAADSRLNALPYWESLQPIPAPGDAPGPDGVDPRYARCARGWERLQRINPMIGPYHPMDPDHIHEDIELQMGDFSSYYWEWLHEMPRWRDHYLSHDQAPHYAYARTMLKVMQWQRGNGRRWVLKAPQHIEQIGPILRVFPDALMVFTHRDPVASLQSILVNMAYAVRVRQKTVDLDGMFTYWSQRVETLLRAYDRDIDAVPAAQRFDVVFDVFMDDDIGMVERVYRAAGLPLTDLARRQFADYLAAHPRGKYGAIDYNLRRDFGVSPAKVRERFGFYFDRVPSLKPEVA